MAEHSVNATIEELPFRQFAQQFPALCWISDSAGRICWVNDAWLAYTGMDVAAIDAHGLDGLHDPAVLPEVRRRWAQARAAGAAAEMVFPLRGRDGRFKPFQTRVIPLRDSSGAVVRWFGVNTDISAQSDAEDRVRDRDEQLREVFDFAADGIVITDGEGRIIEANAATRLLTGYDRDELLRTPVGAIIRPEDQDSEGPAPPGEAHLSERRLRRKDGALLDVEIHSRRLSDGRRLAVVREIALRRRFEQRLADNAQRFRGLADVLPVMIWAADRKGRTRWRNPRMSQFLGLPEISGPISDGDHLHPDDRAQVGRLYAEALAANRPFSAEARVRRHDGEYRWVRLEALPRFDLSGTATGYVGCTIDVTDSHKAAEVLESEKSFLERRLGEGAARAEAAERRLSRFWEVSRDLLAIIPSGASAPQMVNEHAWRETLGYSVEELTAIRLVDLVHPEDLARTEALIGRLDRERFVFGFENRYRRKDGGWCWLSWNVVREGELDFAIARDITKDKIAEAALAQSERQFRLLVAGVVDYALYMLRPDGTVASWNAGAERIKGYAADEVIGRHVSMFYTEEDRAGGAAERALSTAAEQGRYEAEAWRLRKDGEPFWANVVIDAIRDEQGELLGFAKITRDITERRNAQLELQKAQARLALAQKLEAIGQLTGGVAHDFNNLLMVVAGHAQLLRRRVGDDPKAQRALDAIDVASARGQDLTRHLLAFARRQRLRPAPVDLAATASTLRELVTASAGSSVSVSVDIPDTVWPVEVDAGELELAIINMAVNARDAMSAGGELALSAVNVALDADCDLDIQGDFVALSVTDTGSGIAPDILAKVFEPFFTTKDVNRGTGLGLSQVYGFVEQSGGRVRIDSTLGRGTRITLYLPRSTSRPDEDQPAVAQVGPEGLRILVVEDNPEVSEVVAGLLDQLGHTPVMASDAAAALERLRGGERLDLVFSDIVMAGEMNGVDLARWVRRERPGLPVLLATGYSHAAERIDDEFTILTKPYRIHDLAAAITQVMRPEPAAA